jgi:hypothetical protein
VLGDKGDIPPRSARDRCPVKTFSGSFPALSGLAGHCDRGVRRGYWLYPIIDDADLYGAGSSGPASSGERPDRARFQFHKRSQLFISVHNETLSVIAVCVNNPERSPAGINGARRHPQLFVSCPAPRRPNPELLLLA